MPMVNFKKHFPLLLLLAGVFVANNIVHESTHTFLGQLTSQTFSQAECDTCHLSKGTLPSQTGVLLFAPYVVELLFAPLIAVVLTSRFTLYLSRAPPKN